VQKTAVNSSTRNLIIVAGILGVAISTIMIVSFNQQAQINAENEKINAQNEKCQQWSNEIENQRAQLDIKANTIGGKLDLSGNLEAQYYSLNNEIDQYNAE
jgi:uncharacterized membrane protein